MRNLEITEIANLKKVLMGFYDQNHLDLEKSYVEELKGVCMAKFVIDNQPLTLFNKIIPWNNVAQQIYDEYVEEHQKGYRDYHIALAIDYFNKDKWVPLFDAFMERINKGDYVWVNVRTVDDLYKFGSFSSFRRLTSEIYIMRKGWDVSL